MNNFFLKQTFNAQANLLASSDLISGLEGLMSIIFAFDHALTEMGFSVNVCLLVFTLLKIAISFWIIGTDSDKNRTILKWQSRFTFIIAAIAGCLAGGGGEKFDGNRAFLCLRHSRQLIGSLNWT
jgi:hypothetical protein